MLEVLHIKALHIKPLNVEKFSKSMCVIHPKKKRFFLHHIVISFVLKIIFKIYFYDTIK